jgi:hypothetical protein
MERSAVTRETVLAEMERETLGANERCELFRATFRNRGDDWADAAWRRFAGGTCRGQRVGS